ncbi:ubiquitin-like-conjugating enzyme ATG10 isoform X1 [Actinidia eriantha]|uniref:ubiquitin-like-conjugating enzyme ATG10 isoform X1 n=1 Tax=Actinidia eriantha TaxID=165200 RepID=UPI00258DFC46|nr:ubiquitin-like-conjugating enzyme ATG10 isoform X1 [Actinidia eriantha]
MDTEYDSNNPLPKIVAKSKFFTSHLSKTLSLSLSFCPTVHARLRGEREREFQPQSESHNRRLRRIALLAKTTASDLEQPQRPPLDSGHRTSSRHLSLSLSQVMMVSSRPDFDILTWDGTISPSDFRVVALDFAEKWKRFNTTTIPQWSWVPCSKRPWIVAHQREGYLSLENVFHRGSSEENQDASSQIGKEEPNWSDQDDAIDNTTLSCAHETHHYDFHIVYSSSYRVPVLYFRAYCSDGQPLDLDDIEKDLPANAAKVLTESKWTFITQEEHPHLNRPWYTLHPCGTSEWMKLLLVTDASRAKGRVAFEKYLVSWLSVVGQVIGLRTPIEMLRESDQL